MSDYSKFFGALRQHIESMPVEEYSPNRHLKTKIAELEHQLVHADGQINLLNLNLNLYMAKIEHYEAALNASYALGGGLPREVFEHWEAARNELPECGNTPYDEGPFTIAQPDPMEQREVISRFLADKGFYLGKESMDELMSRLAAAKGGPYD